MIDEQPHPDTRVRNRVRPNPATLRRRAEARLSQMARVASNIPLDSTRLLHELQVRQIELEMQHEELQASYGETDDVEKL